MTSGTQSILSQATRLQQELTAAHQTLQKLKSPKEFLVKYAHFSRELFALGGLQSRVESAFNKGSSSSFTPINREDEEIVEKTKSSMDLMRTMDANFTFAETLLNVQREMKKASRAELTESGFQQATVKKQGLAKLVTKLRQSMPKDCFMGLNQKIVELDHKFNGKEILGRMRTGMEFIVRNQDVEGQKKAVQVTRDLSQLYRTLPQDLKDNIYNIYTYLFKNSENSSGGMEVAFVHAPMSLWAGTWDLKLEVVKTVLDQIDDKKEFDFNYDVALEKLLEMQSALIKEYSPLLYMSPHGTPLWEKRVFEHLGLILKNEKGEEWPNTQQAGGVAFKNLSKATNSERVRAIRRTLFELCSSTAELAIKGDDAFTLTKFMHVLEKEVEFGREDLPFGFSHPAREIFMTFYRLHVSAWQQKQELADPHDPKFENDFGRTAFFLNEPGIDNALKVQACSAVRAHLKKTWGIT